MSRDDAVAVYERISGTTSLLCASLTRFIVLSLRAWLLMMGWYIYEAFHVNCPSARRASPKSCYF